MHESSRNSCSKPEFVNNDLRTGCKEDWNDISPGRFGSAPDQSPRELGVLKGSGYFQRNQAGSGLKTRCRRRQSMRDKLVAVVPSAGVQSSIPSQRQWTGILQRRPRSPGDCKGQRTAAGSVEASKLDSIETVFIRINVPAGMRVQLQNFEACRRNSCGKRAE